MTHRIVDIVICILGDHVPVLVFECELSVAEDVECRPCTCLAGPHSAEIERCICVTEAEIHVLAAEISLFACKCDHIRSIEAVLRIIQREGADARLVGVCTDVSVRHPACDPYDALVVRSLSYKVHDPDFVLVGYRE